MDASTTASATSPTHTPDKARADTSFATTAAGARASRSGTIRQSPVSTICVCTMDTDPTDAMET
jgi:hypothetical protein